MRLLPFKEGSVERLTLHHQQLSHLLRLSDAAFKAWLSHHDRHLVAFLTCYAHSEASKDDLVSLLMEQLGDKVLRIILRSKTVWRQLFLITRITLLCQFLPQPHLLGDLLPVESIECSDERVMAVFIIKDPAVHLGAIRGMRDEVAQAACLYALASAQGPSVLANFALSPTVRKSLERYFDMPSQADDFYQLLDDKRFVKANLDHILLEDEDISGDEVDPRLLDAFIKDPALFGRSSRSHPHRAGLLSALKLSHEQLEGWAIMFKRNPRMQQIIYKRQI